MCGFMFFWQTTEVQGPARLLLGCQATSEDTAHTCKVDMPMLLLSSEF